MQNDYPLEHVLAPTPDDILGKLFRNIPGHTQPEAEVFAALANIANNSQFLTVRPVWDSPSYWAKPITNTKVRLVAPNVRWTDFLTHTTDVITSAVIKQYVATVEGDSETSGIEFRMFQNNGILDGVEFVPGQEKFKTDPNEYPVVPRALPIVIDNGGSLTLQVRNTGPLERRVIAAFYGWSYMGYAIAGTGDKSGLVDTQSG